jgi:prepilin-type processing-associated H-X9-DG protein
MLVVVAIIGVLAAMVLPAVQSTREAARRANCQNNLRQLGLAFQQHHDAFRGFPALVTDQNITTDPADTTVNVSTTLPARGWAIDILAFLEQEPIRKAYNLATDFDDNTTTVNGSTNLTVSQNVLKIFQCPSSPSLNRTVGLWSSATPAASLGVTGGATDYFPHRLVGPITMTGTGSSTTTTTTYGNGTPALQVNKQRSMAAMLDGTSQTVLLNEVAMRPTLYINGIRQNNGTTVTNVDAPAWAPWAGFPMTNLYAYEATGTTVMTTTTSATAGCGVNCNNNAGIYAFHPGGANALFVDGSVHFLSKTTAPTVIVSLATRDGSEIVSASSY